MSTSDGRIRYLSIPYPASEDREAANAAWLAAVRLIARARGIDLAVRPRGENGVGPASAFARAGIDPASAPYPGPCLSGPRVLVEAMKALRQWAGNPTLRQLAERAGPGRLPKSSLSDALNRCETLPDLALVRAFVEACGGQHHWASWLQAWQQLAACQAQPGEHIEPDPRAS